MFGEVHAQTADIYNNLAALNHQAKQEYKKAEDYYKKVLKIRLEVFGEADAQTADIYNNLAIFYQNVTKDYKKAEEYYEKVLNIKREVFGDLLHIETTKIFVYFGIFLIDFKKEKNERN